MRKIELNEDNFLKTEGKNQILVLGSKMVMERNYIDNKVKPKIRQDITEPVEDFWGTLELADEDEMGWSGTLKASRRGNHKSLGVTKEEIDRIKECFPHLKVDSHSVTERFLSFEKVNFTLPARFTLEKMPSLILTLMLSREEGALVFYQSRRDFSDEKDGPLVEYILPEATEENETNKRDRLSYHINIIPQKKLKEVDGSPGLYEWTKKKDSKPFIVKILTFRRSIRERRTDQEFHKESSREIIERAERELALADWTDAIAKEHKILVFNRKKNDFEEAKSTKIPLDGSKKTLLLIHGTFASTKNSFGKLYGKDSKKEKDNKHRKWLQSLMDKEKNPRAYDQILAFDHPTLFDGAEENINRMLILLEELNLKKFTQKVDLIGTSQGGLLVQYLANLKDNEQLRVGKAALIASANGVQYLTTGQHVSQFLDALKYIFKLTNRKGAALITSLAQHSAEFLLKQPGLKIMTPGDEKLTQIIHVPPAHRDTLYLPLIDDYDDSIIKEKSDWSKLKKRLATLGAHFIDGFTGRILGKENDWVVGTANQYLVPQKNCAIEGYHPGQYRDRMIPALHGSCIYTEQAQKSLTDFFFGNAKASLRRERENRLYFDAHCHILGRNVLSARIIMLALQDILSYKKAEKKGRSLSSKSKRLKMLKKRLELINNFFKYALMNRDSWDMLRDLEKEYHNLDGTPRRYIPLMFDLEMTFRNHYKEDDTKEFLSKVEKDFKDNLNRFITKNLKTSDKKNGKKREQFRLMKQGLRLLEEESSQLTENIQCGYQKQIEELHDLKFHYGENMFPFLAVDPRRKDMGKIIEKEVGPKKTFRGIKLYTPNGYSPTDPHLFDKNRSFVGGTCLYAYCQKNQIPIIAHCSHKGFATLVNDVEVWGDICPYDKINPSVQTEKYKEPTQITFKYNIRKGYYGEGVKERAHTLNHPALWRLVLHEYKTLKICLAHFGGESIDWQDEIADLMRKHPQVYTDLSCAVKREQLKAIRDKYYAGSEDITSRIMYGSDYFLNLLFVGKFKDYYGNFTDSGLFTEEQIEDMSIHIPKRFLGLEEV
ncbi:MAG: amidohydrolase family protein [Spirochaetales bacterium]|nr:amidohydrolase family protein [Spirochaetales bacterium]